VYNAHIMRRQLFFHFGPRGLLTAQNFFDFMELDDAKNNRVKPMKLSGTYSDLQRLTAVVSRSAGFGGRTGNGVRYDARRDLHGLLARARVYAGRCAHLLHSRPDREGNRRLRGVRRDVLKDYGFENSRLSFPPGTRTNRKSLSAAKSSGTWRPSSLEKKVLKKLGIDTKTNPREARSTDQKIDIKLVDAIGRLWSFHRAFELPICRNGLSWSTWLRMERAAAADGASRALCQWNAFWAC